jgi:hypothetical protein
VRMTRSGRIACGVLLAILAVGTVATSVHAQAVGKSLLDDVRRQNEVAAQKLEADVTSGLAASQKTTDPSRAVEILRGLLAKLEGEASTGVPADRRDALLRTVKERLRVAQAQVATAKSPMNRAGDQHANEVRAQVEAERASAELAKVNALVRAGQNADALRLA